MRSIVLCSDLEYFNTETESCELLDIYFGEIEELVRFEFNRDSPGRSLDNQQDNVKQVIFTQVTDKKIDIQFEFNNPSLVSTDDELVITMDFSVFNVNRSMLKSVVSMVK